MIITYELRGHCPEGHEVIGVQVANVRVNLNSVRRASKHDADLIMVANCGHLCGGSPTITSIKPDEKSARMIAERRAAIREKNQRKVTA